MDASGLWSFVYSIKFQIRQIPATNHHFSSEKSLLLCGSRFLKKNIIISCLRFLVTTGKQIEKIYFATKRMLQNFEGHDHWHSKYITISVIYIFLKWMRCCWNMGIWCYQQGIFWTYVVFSADPFCENERYWIVVGEWGLKLLVPFFQKKCLFWPILNAVINF